MPRKPYLFLSETLRPVGYQSLDNFKYTNLIDSVFKVPSNQFPINFFIHFNGYEQIEFNISTGGIYRANIQLVHSFGDGYFTSKDKLIFEIIEKVDKNLRVKDIKTKQEYLLIEK